MSFDVANQFVHFIPVGQIIVIIEKNKKKFIFGRMQPGGNLFQSFIHRPLLIRRYAAEAWFAPNRLGVPFDLCSQMFSNFI